jgi:hypothetical protein
MFVGSPRLAVIVGGRTCSSPTNFHPILPPSSYDLDLSIIFTYIFGKLDEPC